MIISGKTRVCGVIGDPIEHTLSPVMHNAAFDHLGLDFVFFAFNVKTDDLGNAIHGVRGLHFHGLNVTMPHKNAVVNYLDKLDPIVKFLGSANTILNKEGALLGFNTDGIGAIKALEENNIEMSEKKVLLLGAGGAAKAIAFSLAEEVADLVILNRTVEKAKALAEALRGVFGNKFHGYRLSSDVLTRNLVDSDILINATSLGMKQKPSLNLAVSQGLTSKLAVMDIVYHPIETKLLKDAKAAGSKVISGVEMLIFQAAASFEIWTGFSAPVKVMRKAALNALSR